MQAVAVERKPGRGVDAGAATERAAAKPRASGGAPRTGRVTRGGRLRSALLAAAAVAVAAGLALGAAVKLPGLVARHLAPPLIFFPGHLSADRSAPSDHGLPRGEEVWLRAADGVRLHGWWIPPEGGGGCGAVLFLHGNAGHLAGRAFLARRLSAAGYGALLVDYRGYGRSEGSPDEEGLRLDARAAHRHLLRERGVPPDRLVVAGHSLGAAVAARLATERPAAGVVLTGAFVSVPELGAELYGWLPDGMFRGWPTQRFETRARAAELELPALVARGGRDRVVPSAQTRAVHEALAGPARWHEAPAAGHGDLWADDGFWDVLRPFLDEVTGCG